MLETKTSKSRLRDFNGSAFTSAKLEKGLRQLFAFSKRILSTSNEVTYLAFLQSSFVNIPDPVPSSQTDSVPTKHTEFTIRSMTGGFYKHVLTVGSPSRSNHFLTNRFILEVPVISSIILLAISFAGSRKPTLSCISANETNFLTSRFFIIVIM